MIWPMKNMFDLPPVWLVLAIVLAWLQARFLPLGLSLASGASDLMSGLLIGGGLVLIALAAMEFRKARTTIIPHQVPERLITSGIFSRSRNPIYLGDALILAGVILRLDAVLALVLIPLFVWWIERHFILPEEDRMRRVFRLEFARYEQKVRRWV
jgi:protein-S-isoprenylcysteine O-methyltransferase Ste14